LARQGSESVSLGKRVHQPNRFYPDIARLPLSSTARLRWRLQFTAKAFSCCGPVAGSTATPSSSSARTVIAAIATAARTAARQARLQQRRCANGRYQRSREGRLDHSARQRQYRLRQQAATTKVTDHSSLSIAPPASLSGGQVEASESQPLRPEPATWQPPRCCICGRVFRYINPYPRIPQRK
jgi:hypothetical protein